MKRKIEPIEINGKIVFIEVENVELSKNTAFIEKDNSSDLTDGYKKVSKGKKEKGYIETLKGKVADISDLVSSVVESVEKGMDTVKPDEWSVEFNVGYKVEKEIKIPFISGKGDTSGGLKITATWKKDAKNS